MQRGSFASTFGAKGAHINGRYRGSRSRDSKDCTHGTCGSKNLPVLSAAVRILLLTGIYFLVM